MNPQNPSTYYNCKICSRITTGFPIGCSERNCPVKTDFWADFFWGIVFFIIMFVFLFGFILFFIPR